MGRKITEKILEERIEYLVQEGVLFKKEDRVATRKDFFKLYEQRRRRSIYYYKKAGNSLSWMSSISSILFLGVSGSLSMLNMTEKGDIDIFIIAGCNSIWRTRFLLLLYKYILKLTNPDIGNKLCFNMIFSESGLEIGKNKQNEYIGHELLQLKPVINKNDIHDKFIQKNLWIKDFFPNVQIKSRKSKMSKELSKRYFHLNMAEEILRKIQVWWLGIKNIHWVYRKGQLWLIQEDFEKKILKNHSMNGGGGGIRTHVGRFKNPQV